MLSRSWSAHRAHDDFLIIGSGYGGAIAAARLATANVSPRPSICVSTSGEPALSGRPPWTISVTGSPVKILDMRLACTHAYRMSKMVQIRNVPEALHRKLKVRAADSGQTLSDYLLAELERLAARPTRDEMLTRLHTRKRVTLKTPAATVIREERESA